MTSLLPYTSIHTYDVAAAIPGKVTDVYRTSLSGAKEIQLESSDVIGMDLYAENQDKEDADDEIDCHGCW